MRHELHQRIAHAIELGRTATVTPHVAESLAVFAGCDTAEQSYAVGMAGRGGRVVAAFGATASVVLVVAGDDIHRIVDAEREPLELTGTSDAAAFTLAPGRSPELTGMGHAVARATIVAAAEQTGVARAALDHAVAYASERQQFGAPIASYQALAHRLVDMAIAVEAAELAVEQAGVEPMLLHAARAKICADHAAELATAGLHQVHGGVGYLAGQAPAPLFARALALSVELGDRRHHRRLVARHHRLLA